MRMIMRGMRGIKGYDNIRNCDDDITCRSVHGDETELTTRLEIRSAWGISRLQFVMGIRRDGHSDFGD